MFFYDIHTRLFPYGLVSKGKINFNFDQFERTLKYPNLWLYILAYILIFVVITIFVDALKWLSKNRDSFIKVLSNSVSFTLMLLIAYMIFLSSSFDFLKDFKLDH